MERYEPLLAVVRGLGAGAGCKFGAASTFHRERTTMPAIRLIVLCSIAVGPAWDASANHHWHVNATEERATAAERQYEYGAETIDGAVATCTGQEDAKSVLLEVHGRIEVIVCVDSTSEAHAGCAYVHPEFRGLTTAGVIVADDATGYVPCDEVPELLSRSAQQELQTTLDGLLRELKKQTELLREICTAARDPAVCGAAHR